MGHLLRRLRNWTAALLGDAKEVDATGGVLPDEGHIQPVERKRVDTEEVRGENAPCLGAQELPPGGAVVARRGVDAGSLQDRPHRTRRDRLAEPGEFALDPTVTPGGVLRGQSQDQLARLECPRAVAGAAAGLGPP